jgi:hypothetical protein
MPSPLIVDPGASRTLALLTANAGCVRPPLAAGPQTRTPRTKPDQQGPVTSPHWLPMGDLGRLSLGDR